MTLQPQQQLLQLLHLLQLLLLLQLLQLLLLLQLLQLLHLLQVLQLLHLLLRPRQLQLRRQVFVDRLHQYWSQAKHQVEFGAVTLIPTILT